MKQRELYFFAFLFIWGCGNDDTSTDSGTDTDTDIDSDTDSDTTEFVTVWNTIYWSNSSSENDQIELPLVSNGEYGFTVRWGDGIQDSISSSDDPARIHTYNKVGIYEVIITGLIKGWAFDVSSDRQKLLEIKSWGPLSLGETTGQFNGCSNLSICATDIPDLSETTSLGKAFANCSSLDTIPFLTDWNTSNIDDMSYMFQNDVLFDQDLSGLDTSNVTDMTYMFSCDNVDSFYVHTFNGNISDWDTSNVTDMTGMFYLARVFNQDISNWDTSNVTDMSEMFFRANAFNIDISNWDTSNVKSFRNMFAETIAFNQDISGWNTSKVTDMW